MTLKIKLMKLQKKLKKPVVPFEVKVIKQTGKGKANAVWEAVEEPQGSNYYPRC